MGLLQGKIAIVTGGSDGIGRAIAENFAANGAHVEIIARNADKLAAVTGAIEASGGSATAHSLDLSNPEKYAQLIDSISAKSGLDILVNNAPHVGYGMIADTELADFRQNFLVNVDASYVGIKAAMKHMQSKGGSIMNISSINGDRAMQGMSGYSASKAALTHLTRLAAMEGGRQAIRVNSIVPGPIMTPGTKTYFDSAPEAGEAIAQANPMGRIGNPEEVATVALFLASNMSSYVNGASIPVDGGKTNELYVPS